MLAMSSSASWAVNPFLPLWEYIPDGEPYVFEDPDNPGKYRVYVYGSHDSLINNYCGREQVVWSAPVDDLANWRYDGIIFLSKTDANGDLLNADGSSDVLFAPDVAMMTNADGSKTYYLYPNDQNGGRNSLVAKADRPDGPFVVCNWSKDNPKATVGPIAFDPAVFVDDDGRVYAYWGFERSYGAEFDPSTMATVLPGTEIVEDMIPDRHHSDDFRFFEASSMRKIKDKYVFVYSRWTKDGDFGLPQTNYTLAYAYSDSPLGPFTYGGTIIDGRARMALPDGTVIPTATPTGNTHGSIIEIDGKWWVFYHRQTGTTEFSRQAMVAPIDVYVEEGPGGKVVISEAEYTSEGFQTDGLAFSGIYPAGIASYYTGPGEVVSEYPNKYFPGSYVKPTYWNGDPAKAPADLQYMSCPVTNNTSGSVVGYKYFNFDTAADDMDMTVTLRPGGVDGTVKVLIGGPSAHLGGREVGEFSITAAEPRDITTKTVKLRGLRRLQGRQPLFFVFSSPVEGVSTCDLYNFSF